MSRTIHVDLGPRGYDIHVVPDLLACRLHVARKGLRALIVSDSNVDPLYGAQVQEWLEQAGLHVKRVMVPAGETSKSLSSLVPLYGEAVEAGLDRSSLIVALGGGMIGDLAGFVAATFMRGIALVQVPTSLVAMVDSAVGGKTAINLPQGKNLVGAFYQPVEVVIVPSYLGTLPEREYRSGLAEVMKYGIIWDINFFQDLEENVPRFFERCPELLERVVARCCEIKAEVVARDEKESSVRAILNFGHTLGHALENVTGYELLLHGEAVAVGMVFAAELSVAVKGFSHEDCGRIIQLLKRLGLPYSPHTLPVAAPDWSELRRAMMTDKKARNGLPRFVLVEQLGSAVFGCEVAEDILCTAYAKMLES
ncbi:MAG: 3-dehydroquinate synthase [Kiritimatiellia bacterium]